MTDEFDRIMDRLDKSLDRACEDLLRLGAQRDVLIAALRDVLDGDGERTPERVKAWRSALAYGSLEVPR